MPDVDAEITATVAYAEELLDLSEAEITEAGLNDKIAACRREYRAWQARAQKADTLPEAVEAANRLRHLEEEEDDLHFTLCDLLEKKRGLTPTESALVKRCEASIREGPVFRPGSPCVYEPGPDKVETLARRFATGRTLWHPDDPTILPDRLGFAPVKADNNWTVGRELVLPYCEEEAERRSA